MHKPTINDVRPKRRLAQPKQGIVSPELVAPPKLKAVLEPQQAKDLSRLLAIIFMVIALITVLVLVWIMYTNIKAS